MSNVTLPVKTAIVGCGRIGRVHTERLHADGRARVVALVDSNVVATEQLRDERARDALVFADVEAMLAANLVRAAVIATPTSLHFDQVMACRQHGLDVLCEKPLADTRDSIVALIEDAVRGGPLLSVAYQRRCWATYRTLKREVQSGRWGKVQAVTGHNAENWQQTIAGTWRDDPAMNPGGFIGDAGSHKIDSVFYVTGLKPVEVFAHCDNCGSHVEIVATVSAKLEGDVPWSIDFVGNAARFAEDLHIHLSGADLMIRDGKLWIARHGRLEPWEQLLPESNPDAAFLDVLEGKVPNFAPPQCALPVFDFTRALLESSRNRRIVSVDTGT